MPQPELIPTTADTTSCGLEPYGMENPVSDISDNVLLGPNPDPIFRSLVELNVGVNYINRTRTLGIHYHEGVERDRKSVSPLFTATLYVDVPGIEQRAVQDHVDLVGPLSIDDLERKLISEEGDGAYVAYTVPGGYHVSQGRHIMMVNPRPIVERLKKAHPERDIQKYVDVFDEYLPPDFVHFDDESLAVGDIGSRTRFALTVPVLLEGGRTYMIKQSV